MSRLREKDARQRQESNRSPDFSEALARGLKVIGAFSSERPQLTMSDIARAVDLPRATARRAIYTLTELGYLASEGRLFRLTPKVLELASFYLKSNPVTTLLQPVCDRISRTLEEACSVAVLDNTEVVMIAHTSPLRFIAVAPGVGYRLPAFCTSLGRVLLAGLPDRELNNFLARLEPRAPTPYTVTDKDVLRQRIEAVREQGYAIVTQEAETGFRSIAVPIRRHDGAVIAAINVGGRIETVTEQEMLDGHLELLRRETGQLQNRLL
ncbi:MAG: IclR family transcriptional regulator C-terminal domain-containing protein [Aquisalimonadaceae bacterium]